MVNNGTKRTAVIIAALTAIVFCLYIPVAHHEFIILDDHQYVARNSHVTQGLTGDGLAWAWTSLSRSNWHPLTWISHMLDVELFGVNAGAHHLVSVLHHALSTGLLFLALLRMTGAVWRSALVAALFGIHPLHVESVAWVAERKDVLSGLILMLVLLAYVRFVRRPAPGRYALVVLLFALGLMAKPMLVTAPFLLLLLDIWPLGRTSLSAPADGSTGTPTPWPRLVLEKVPLLCLSLASAVVTIIAQSRTISSLEVIPLSLRLSNAGVSYVSYLVKTVWPFSLSIYYPYPASIPFLMVLGSMLVLATISVIVLRRLRQSPYLAVGWFWYLLMLLPVIGFIQVGRQSMADRYTYLPHIGLFLAVVWFATEKVRNLLPGMLVRTTAATLVLVPLCVITFLQVGHWKDSVTLFSHAVAVTEDNPQAEKGLAISLSAAGKNTEAIPHFLKSLQMKYDDAETHRNLAYAFADLRDRDRTIFHLREALRFLPDDVLTRQSLQYYLMQAP